MLHSVTWTHYLIAVLLAATAYYIFVGIRFYANDIRSLVSGNSKGGNESGQPAPAPTEAAYLQTDPDQLALSFADTTDETFGQVEQLVGRIKAAVARAADKGDGTEPLVRSLGVILSGYGNLKGSHFQPAINELIRDECENLGLPVPDETETAGLWG